MYQDSKMFLLDVDFRLHSILFIHFEKFIETGIQTSTRFMYDKLNIYTRNVSDASSSMLPQIFNWQM